MEMPPERNKTGRRWWAQQPSVCRSVFKDNDVYTTYYKRALSILEILRGLLKHVNFSHDIIVFLSFKVMNLKKNVWYFPDKKIRYIFYGGPQFLGLRKAMWQTLKEGRMPEKGEKREKDALTSRVFFQSDYDCCKIKTVNRKHLYLVRVPSELLQALFFYHGKEGWRRP